MDERPPLKKKMAHAVKIRAPKRRKNRSRRGAAENFSLEKIRVAKAVRKEKRKMRNKSADSVGKRKKRRRKRKEMDLFYSRKNGDVKGCQLI